MNNDKITDEEIDALDNVDLLELGHNFLVKGDGQRALKCFLRAAEPDKSRIGKIIGLSTAAEIYRYGLGGVPVDGHKAIDLYKKLGGYNSDLCIAEIYAKGCGEVVADGYKALEIYREMIRSIEIFVQGRWNMFGDSGVEFAVTEDYLGEDYPYYIEALRGQAEIYRYGLGGVPADGHKAIDLYQKIGGYDSDFKIAEIYADGCGEVVADGYKALEIYREMIRSIESLVHCGDSDVEFAVTKDYLGEDYPYYIRALRGQAIIYLYGLGGVPVDAHKAIELYQKVGDHDSDFKIAEIYKIGCGEVVADGYKALEIYREMIRSIEVFVQSRWNFCGDSGVEFAVTEDYLGSDYLDYIEALRGQAEIYRFGTGGVPVDAHKAIELYQKVGDHDSYFKIAEIYEDGCGNLLADGYKALEIYREMIRSIESLVHCGDSDVEFAVTKDYLGSDYLDYIEALRGQAEIYRFGTGGVPVDAHKAIELYQKVGDHDSYFKIAEIYEDGCGDLLADGYKALEIYRHIMRRCGDGTKAMALVQQLHEMFGDEFVVVWQYPPEEYLKSLRGQAEIFRFGTGGVPADGRKALKYYKRIVKLVFGTLDIHSLDADEKFKRIRADGEVDHLYAVRALADISNMYRYGEAGIRPNPRKAEKFYELATYLDHEYLIDENFRSWRRNEDERDFD